jgi:hypothetical protein
MPKKKSERKSNQHYVSFTADVAVNKNTRAIKVVYNKTDGWVGFAKEYHDYLQVCTGVTRCFRNVLVADVDVCDGISSDEVVNNVLDVCLTIGFVFPSMYQIHLSNNHIQFYWLFTESVAVKRYDRESKTIKSLSNHKKYNDMRLVLFCLMNGDRKFTGWRIKNPFCDTDYAMDEKNGFKTIFLTDKGWSDKDPNTYVKYDFKRMYECLMSVYERCGESIGRLYELGNICGQWSSSDDFVYFLQHRKDKSVEIDEKTECNESEESDNAYRDLCLSVSGRNEFVRRYTYRVVRENYNKITKDRCRELVFEKLKDFKKDNPKSDPYTDEEFGRDFSGAYDNAVANFDENLCKQKSTERQIQNSIINRKCEKIYNMIKMVNYLQENKFYTRNCLKFNKVVADYLGMSVETVRKYKEELCIDGKTCEIKRKNLKFLTENFFEYYNYVNAIGNYHIDRCIGVYKYKSKKDETEMLDRIHSVFDKETVDVFMKNNPITKNADRIKQIQTEWQAHV